MASEEPGTLEELAALLDEIEAISPTRDDVAGSAVLLRSVEDVDALDDSPTSEEADEPLPVAAEGPLDLSEAPMFEFAPAGAVPVAAVDCGIVRLGETENGLVIALRAAIVVDDQDNAPSVTLFRTGPLYLHNQHKAEILYQVGRHLGRPDFFVRLDDPERDSPIPTEVRDGVADDSHQYGDRFRNWLERLAQRIAVNAIENGVVFFDGALTLRTRDTPRTYLESLAESAAQRGNAIVAVSKQSRLQLGGRPIPFWLNDVPGEARYRLLTPVMRAEGEERVLGDVFAVRFSPLGPTFRMDVKPAEGQSSDEAIARAYNNTLMRAGYPEILVRAHAHSYFTSPDVLQLQAEARAKYLLVPQPEVQLSGIFAPFGGRFK